MSGFVSDELRMKTTLQCLVVYILYQIVHHAVCSPLSLPPPPPPFGFLSVSIAQVFFLHSVVFNLSASFY